MHAQSQLPQNLMVDRVLVQEVARVKYFFGHGWEFVYPLVQMEDGGDEEGSHRLFSAVSGLFTLVFTFEAV